MKFKLFVAFLFGVLVTYTVNYFLSKKERIKYNNSFIESQIKKNEHKLEILNSSELNPFFYDTYNRFVLKSDSIASLSKKYNVLGVEFYKIIPSFLHFDSSEVVNLINASIGYDGFSHSLNILKYSVLIELLDSYRSGSIKYDAIFLKISNLNDTLRLGDYFVSDLSIGLLDFKYPYIGIVDKDTLPYSPMGLPRFSEKTTYKGINKRKAKLLYNNWGIIDSLELEFEYYVK